MSKHSQHNWQKISTNMVLIVLFVQYWYSIVLLKIILFKEKRPAYRAIILTLNYIVNKKYCVIYLIFQKTSSCRSYGPWTLNSCCCATLVHHNGIKMRKTKDFLHEQETNLLTVEMHEDIDYLLDKLHSKYYIFSRYLSS